LKKDRPFIPVDRDETLRQKIISVLKEHVLSAKDISAAVSASEKEVYDHLAHIQKSAHKKSYTLVISPAKCKKCGFSFKKREKLRKPGKCPLCRGESIEEPLFSIK
jgi:predicted Zn-ribbon and HTH transcriptional regulator